MSKWLLLAAGGVSGTISRYLLMQTVTRWLGPAFPAATLSVNLTGCLLAGILAGALSQQLLAHRPAYFLLVAGFLSAFTTFSTMIVDGWHLLQAGRLLAAGGYLFGSVLLGMAALWLGLLIGRLVS
jgi:CrcB protein